MKRIFSIVIAVLIVVSVTIPVYAERIEVPYLDLKGISVLGFESFVIWTERSTGMPAYCLDAQKGLPDGELLATELDPENIYSPYYEELKSLIFAGYPFQKGGLSDEKAQGCTQFALWCWMWEKGRSGYNYREFNLSPGKEYDFFMSILNAGLSKTPTNLGLSAADVFLGKKGDILTGETTVNCNNLKGNYSIDKGLLPEGMTVSGYTGKNGDVLTFEAPLSFAGKSFNLDHILLGHDSRSPLSLLYYENKDPTKQNMVIPVLDQTSVAISAGIKITAPKFSIKKVASNSESGVGGATVYVGDKITYEIVYNNITGKKADLTITDKLPEGLAYVSATDEKGNPLTGYTSESRTINWKIDNVPVDGSGKVTITMVVTQDADTTITNMAELAWNPEGRDIETENPDVTIPVEIVFELPRTGSGGAFWFMLIGGILLAGGVICIGFRVCRSHKRVHTPESDSSKY